MDGASMSTAAVIVLVHGGFVDGSGWQSVYKILTKDGYSVSIVQNPTATLEDDVAVTRRVIASQKGQPRDLRFEAGSCRCAEKAAKGVRLAMN